MPGKKSPENERREEILQAAFRVALRRRVAGLTSREVSADAGVSNGLLFFHFRNRQELLLALLDWLLAQTILAHAIREIPEPGLAEVCMAKAIREAIETMPRHREQIELFFDYWFTASHNDELMRKKIRAALGRYRRSYVPLARAVVAESPQRYRGVTPGALASVATGLIEGCAMNLVMNPKSFHPGGYAGAMAALLREPRGIMNLSAD
ncbi:MAG TPA: TetR family transcriptional regulator [Bryobacteraceae bacterium]|nr:TetR family transcriptional regulator [Bryobacteraceae bacterium]